MNVRLPSRQMGSLFAVMLLAALLLAACQPTAATTATLQPNTAPEASNTGMPTAAATNASTATSAPASTATSAPAAAATSTGQIPQTGGNAATGPATLEVANDPTLGPILVDDRGMTLYMFTKDEPNKVNCAGKCLEAWPPFLTEGEPVAGEGVDADLIGTATMEDGSIIVTYNQMPLYYWAADTKAGDTTGQGVNDVWYVVDPEGNPVGMPQTSTLMVANDPTHGPILVDSKGMTLYMFTKDEPNKVNCAGKCLEAWPPFLTEGEPVAGEGVDPALIGTATMEDGSMIVTYNQMPLYYWAADTKPGDATGQGVNDVWYVVAPDGKPVGMPQSSTGSGGDY